MNLNPKERFMETDSAKVWREAVTSVWFQNGLVAALAQTMMSAGTTGDNPAAAAAAFNRMEGAKALIVVMMNLAENPPPTRKPERQNLTPPS